MRQLFIEVPRGRGEAVAAQAREWDARNIWRIETTGERGPTDLVIVHLSNRRVERLLEWLEPIPGHRVAFAPQGVFALYAPVEEAPDEVVDVEPRSPLEIYLGGLQSVGSWKGFLAYAAIAAVVVWIGLFTNTIFLLTAAMLIAPFAGPAMNAALATAVGDRRLLGRSVLRYLAALAVSVAVAALLSFAARQQTPTPQMIQRSQISIVASLLALTAGAAGATNLVLAERNSLVSGAATGMLVAASLAPPAGLIGMAAAIGRWDLTRSAAFLLALQLVGINLAGAVTFRVAGLTRGGTRFRSETTWLFPVSLALTLAALGGLLYVQVSQPVALERASATARIAERLQQTLERDATVRLLEINVRFPRRELDGRRVVLADVSVAPASDAPPADRLRADLTRRLQQRIRSEWPSLAPLVNVTVLEPPPK